MSLKKRFFFQYSGNTDKHNQQRHGHTLNSRSLLNAVQQQGFVEKQARGSEVTY